MNNAVFNTYREPNVVHGFLFIHISLLFWQKHLIYSQSLKIEN